MSDAKSESKSQATGAPRNGWVLPMLIMVPGDIRQQFRGDLLAERIDMRARGWAPWRINFATAGLLLAGVAQHVPLSRIDARAAEQPDVAGQAAVAGWVLWRVCGPMMLLGYLLSSWILLLSGGLCLLGAFGCITAVVIKGREPYDNREARLLNGVFGGVVAVLATTLLLGAVFSALLAVGLLVGSTLLGALAVKSLVFLVLTFVAGLCAVGWVPEEWEPARMVRH